MPVLVIVFCFCVCVCVCVCVYVCARFLFDRELVDCGARILEFLFLFLFLLQRELLGKHGIVTRHRLKFAKAIVVVSITSASAHVNVDAAVQSTLQVTLQVVRGASLAVALAFALASALASALALAVVVVVINCVRLFILVYARKNACVSSRHAAIKRYVVPPSSTSPLASSCIRERVGRALVQNINIVQDLFALALALSLILVIGIRIYICIIGIERGVASALAFVPAFVPVLSELCLLLLV